MQKIKLVLAGMVLAAGIAGVVVVSSILSGNRIKKDVTALKSWEVPKGVAAERISKKSKKLGEIKVVLQHGEKAVAPLLDALGSWPAEETKGVMVALALLGEDKGVGPVCDRMKEGEGDAAAVAAAALGIYGKKAVPPLKKLAEGLGDLPPAVRSRAYQAMAWTRADELLGALAGGLKDADATVAALAAELLSTRKSEALVQPLLEALGSDIEALSAAAARGLVHNKSDVKPAQLEPFVKSATPHVRAHAAEVLGYMDRIFANRMVAGLLEDSSPKVVVAAADALHMMGEKVKSETVLPLLETADDAVVEAAAGVLLKIKAEDHKDRYTSLLTHKNPVTRKAAAKLIALCAKSNPGSLMGEACIPALIEMLKDADLAETAGNALRLWTREHSLDNDPASWTRWWEVYRERQRREDEAKAIYDQVKAWLDSGEIQDRAQEGVDLIEKAKDLYQEIIDKNLSPRSYDNEFMKLNVLERQARTHLMD